MDRCKQCDAPISTLGELESGVCMDCMAAHQKDSMDAYMNAALADVLREDGVNDVRAR
ncbi:MAG: hypothetical protein WBK88_07130 [Methanothrix sp.]